MIITPGTMAELNKIITPDVRIFPHEEQPSSSLSGNSCHNIDKRSFSWTVPLINIVLFYPQLDPTKFMFEMLNWQKVDSINISAGKENYRKIFQHSSRTVKKETKQSRTFIESIKVLSSLLSFLFSQSNWQWMLISFRRSSSPHLDKVES